MLSVGFPGGSVVKNLPAVQEMQETRVQSLGQEDPLEKEVATRPSILAWRIPWTEEPGGLWSVGSQRVGYNIVTEHAGMCSCFTMLSVSAIQQSESAICLHISPLFWISFPYRSP